MRDLVFGSARLNSVAGAAPGLPTWTAWLSGFAETFGGIALAAGFMTRPAALAIAINLGVAGFLRHAADPTRPRSWRSSFSRLPSCIYSWAAAGLPSIGS